MSGMTYLLIANIFFWLFFGCLLAWLLFRFRKLNDKISRLLKKTGLDSFKEEKN